MKAHTCKACVWLRNYWTTAKTTSAEPAHFFSARMGQKFSLLLKRRRRDDNSEGRSRPPPTSITDAQAINQPPPEPPIAETSSPSPGPALYEHLVNAGHTLPPSSSIAHTQSLVQAEYFRNAHNFQIHGSHFFDVQGNYIVHQRSGAWR